MQMNLGMVSLGTRQAIDTVVEGKLEIELRAVHHRKVQRRNTYLIRWSGWHSSLTTSTGT